MAENAQGDECRPLRVAIVGAGPSAFYAAEALLNAKSLPADAAVDARVDVFDRLPTPYGLVRGGVAPDHQKIKNVVRVYRKIATDPRCRFFGNVMLGRDISVADLREHYDQIVFAVGNESDRRMDLPGEDLAGVHSATDFVGWYNGHPDHREREFALASAARVVVVGNGNVAIDVARLLARAPEQLAETDIADYALASLRASSVREVVLLGRRGPAQAAFSPKEIAELAGCEGVEVVVSPTDAELDPVSQEWLASQPRSAQRNVDFLLAQSKASKKSEVRCRVVCRFLVSPVEFVAGDSADRVTSVRIEHGELRPDKRGTPRPVGTGAFDDIEADIVFKAVGYRGVPIEGVPFDEGWGVIPNAEGRVLDRVDGEVVPGQYVVGWAKRGPTGLIGTNSPDSKETVARMLEDAAVDRDTRRSHDGGIPELLQSRGVDVVSLEDWDRLDAYEIERGEREGKVRSKLTSIDEMLAAIRELRADAS